MKDGQAVAAKTLEDYSSSDDDISVSDVSSTDSENGQELQWTEQRRKAKRIRDDINGDNNIREGSNRDKVSRKRKKKYHKDKTEKKRRKKRNKRMKSERLRKGINDKKSMYIYYYCVYINRMSLIVGLDMSMRPHP